MTWRSKCGVAWLMLMGCTGTSETKAPDPVEDSNTTDAGVDNPSGLPADDCAAAADIGEAGGFGLDSFTVPFVYDAGLDLSVSPVFAVSVPDDVLGLSVTVDAGAMKGGVDLVEIDGRVAIDRTGAAYEGPRRRALTRAGVDTSFDTSWDSATDTSDTAWSGKGRDGWGVSPFYHYPELAGTIVMPMSVETPPWAGCMRVRAAVEGDASAIEGTVHLATKRSAASAHTMDVNLIVVEGAGISAKDLRTAVDIMAEVYAGADGPVLGAVNQFEVTLKDGPFVSFNGDDIRALRATATPGAPANALNLFFIKDFINGAGTLGIASGIPGPMAVQGTAASGVIMSIEGHRNADMSLDVSTMGETMAHEAGHQMGLFHTSESDGLSHDVIADTPECDAATYDTNQDNEVDAAECEAADGVNFMFWSAGDYPQRDMSADQAFVLNHSPICN